MSHKLGTLPTSQPRSPPSSLDPSSTPLKAAIPRRLSDVSSSGPSEAYVPNNQDLDVLPFAIVELEAAPSSKASPRVLPNYSSAVRASPRRAAAVLELGSSGSTTNYIEQ
ncbi:hypothetical protein K443DRAFT_672401 [Laccaria amethystina LaAM-08-1]|jgi:hypothetical protein|uniref:Uncharacterized protein n=1 Tax=Laccaria amethystina LaAM-08-1 TaxID=1095629 RepID=A0A0C9Y3B0_9AGAR|nr:hypothetical protein K443DRAFT_672401 [Laccaria amethystina LaAM-08-1]